jgi:hypothetical protein
MPRKRTLEEAYHQKAINVGAEERVALHDIRLDVGDVSNTAHVATDSSDRAISINSTQIDEAHAERTGAVSSRR